jgi:hypothetical protein
MTTEEFLVLMGLTIATRIMGDIYDHYKKRIKLLITTK